MSPKYRKIYGRVNFKDFPEFLARISPCEPKGSHVSTSRDPTDPSQCALEVASLVVNAVSLVVELLGSAVGVIFWRRLGAYNQVGSE